MNLYFPRKIEAINIDKKVIFGLMKATLSSEDQIFKAINEHVAGRKAEDRLRNLGISQWNFDKSRSLRMIMRGVRGAH